MLRYNIINMSESLTEERVYEALEEVIDPELGLDFVSLGLIYSVEISEETISITYSLTTPACPIGDYIRQQIEDEAAKVSGERKIIVKLTFNPPWSPEMMSGDAQFALGF